MDSINKLSRFEKHRQITKDHEIWRSETALRNHGIDENVTLLLMIM